MLGLNQSLGSSDFVQIATLAAVTKPLPPTNCLSGLISVDTTLHATNSPYAICGDLTISTNVTLTVEPGTTVQMDSGVNLAVANGGGASWRRGRKPARFTLHGCLGLPLPFGSIPGRSRFAERPIAYADFEGNSTVCIEVAGGTLNLNHSTFLTTTHQYVGLDSSSFLISHCVFPTSSATFELVHGTGGINRRAGHCAGLLFRQHLRLQ